MSRYLEEAANLLRKSAAENDRDSWPEHGKRVQIAREFAMLAAIDKGLLPADIVQDVLRAVADRNA
ncbi:hypothetical protein [Streptomyces celluloflavus]|uniref:hypothetical protein n=1 Tax=Streptomyces celluloflavus TaxID=58344 RepID=UPI00368FA288